MPKQATERGNTKAQRNQQFTFTKTLGQHILINAGIIDDMVARAQIKPTDTILEIGPGTGNMTLKMLPHCKKLVAVEFDRRMVVELKKRVQNTELEKKLQIIHSDILQVDLPRFDLCIANIPYNISSKIVFKLLHHSINNPFRNCFLMFQREFALRLVAQPKTDAWCRLACNAQLLANCQHVMKISKNSYRPPPKVDSSVVMIQPYHPPPPVPFLEWDGLTRIMFNRKHKKLHSIFTNKNVIAIIEQNYETYCIMKNLPLDEEFTKSKKKFILDRVESIIGVDEFKELRPAQMKNDDILKLLTQFNEKGIHFTAVEGFFFFLCLLFFIHSQKPKIFNFFAFFSNFLHFF